MKKIIVSGAVAAIAAVTFAGNASAAPANPVPGTPQCFGQIHKLINTDGALGFTNVGDVVNQFGGQGKNTVARGQCAI